jgi:hypothetical protein
MRAKYTWVLRDGVPQRGFQGVVSLGVPVGREYS